MKRVYLLLVATLLAMAGCTEKEPAVVVVEDAYVEISAILQDTKTAYEPNLTKGYWSESDQLGAYIYRKVGGEFVPTIENLRYDNAGEERSSVSKFTSSASFNVHTGDVLVGYYPYSEEQEVDLSASVGGFTRAAVSLARPFSLGDQVQSGDNSTAHIGANDFLVATPTTITESMIEGNRVNVPFTFTHAFAALKIVVTNDYARKFTVKQISLESSNGATSLAGDFAIDIYSPSVAVVDGRSTVALTVENCGNIEVGSTFTGYLMVYGTTLPAGSTVAVVTSAGTFKVQTASAIELHRGYVETLNFSATDERLTDRPTAPDVADCWGSWRLAEYCGAEVDFDIYMTLNSDYSFVLYQRTSATERVTFTGTYTYDDSLGIFGGTYSDGKPWAMEYALISIDASTLIWANTANADEVSVYVRTDIPSTMLGCKAKAKTNVKRFL